MTKQRVDQAIVLSARSELESGSAQLGAASGRAVPALSRAHVRVNQKNWLVGAPGPSRDEFYACAAPALLGCLKPYLSILSRHIVRALRLAGSQPGEVLDTVRSG